MAGLTITLLNYRRPDNILTILDSVARQTVVPQVFLWNNAGPGLDSAAVTWRVNSSVNRFCWPRWFMSARAQTEFVAVLDDDLCFSSDTFVERLVRYMQTLGPEARIVGLEGVLFGQGREYYPTYGGRMARSEVPPNYSGTVHIAGARQDTYVDVVKGRFMVCRTGALKNLPISPPMKDVCDDIVISSLLRKGDRPCHVIPGWLSQEFVDLPEKNGSMALSAQFGFRDLRQEAAQIYFPG
jgi:hypothetical protein